METTRKILSFHREDRCTDPNNPQSILLDFISSCQNLRIWSLNTSTREYLNNEQLQKGKQIDEWWRQVSKGKLLLNLLPQLSFFHFRYRWLLDDDPLILLTIIFMNICIYL